MTDLDLIKQFKEACLTGQMDVIRECIAQGVDYTGDNNYGLVVAAATDRVDVVKYLLENTDLKFDFQNNYLFRISCRHQNLNLIKFLIDYSQKVNKPIDYSNSFIQVCEEENGPVLKHLLTHAKIKPSVLSEGFIQLFIRAKREMFEDILYAPKFKLTDKIKNKLQNIYNKDNTRHDDLKPLMNSIDKYELNKNLSTQLNQEENHKPNIKKIKI